MSYLNPQSNPYFADHQINMARERDDARRIEDGCEEPPEDFCDECGASPCQCAADEANADWANDAPGG